MLEAYRQDYDIGSSGRYLPSPKGVHLQGSGADYHYRDETKFFRAIERARFYDRNNMIVGQGIDRLCDNLIRDGFTLDPLSSDAGFNAEAKAKFWDWGLDPDQCDDEQECTFPDFELAGVFKSACASIQMTPIRSLRAAWKEAAPAIDPAASE